jgi:hypothetical protein
MPKSAYSIAVVFDTNPIFNTSSTDLIRGECADFVQKTKPHNVTISWHLPATVKEERIFQMQEHAGRLTQHVVKLEAILGRSINASKVTLDAGVERLAAETMAALNIQELPLDASRVNWPNIIINAVKRVPPFERGEKEKGFRDALIAEAFLQLCSDHAEEHHLIVLVTNDDLLRQAVEESIPANARVVRDLAGLETLINTQDGALDEAFIKELLPLARRLFCSIDDKTGIFYTKRVKERIKKELGKELDALPSGVSGRRCNQRWLIGQPVFLTKRGYLIHWRSTITLTYVVKQKLRRFYASDVPARQEIFGLTTPTLFPADPSPLTISLLGDTPELGLPRQGHTDLEAQKTYERTTHVGKDLYDVDWTAEVKEDGLDAPSVLSVSHQGNMATRVSGYFGYRA